MRIHRVILIVGALLLSAPVAAQETGTPITADTATQVGLESTINMQPLQLLNMSSTFDSLLFATSDGVRLFSTAALDQPPTIFPAFHRDTLSSAASFDGSVYAFGHVDGHVTVWQNGVETGVTLHDAPVDQVAVSRNGNTLVSADQTGDLRGWKLGSRLREFEIGGHDGMLVGLALDEGGEYLVSAGTDDYVRLWDTSRGALLWETILTAASVAISRDATRIIVGGRDGIIYQWPLNIRSEGMVVPEHPSFGNAVPPLLSFQPDARLERLPYNTRLNAQLGAGDSAHEYRFDGSAGMQMRVEFFAPSSALMYFELYAPHSTTPMIVSETGQNVLLEWDGDYRLVVRPPLGGSANYILWLAVGAVNAQPITGTFPVQEQIFLNYGQFTKIGEVGTPYVIPAHQGGVLGLALNASEQLLASIGSDNTTRLWDAAERRLLAELPSVGGDLLGVTFLASSNALAFAERNGIVRVWTGSELQTYDVRFPRLYDVSYPLFADGDQLALASADGRVKVVSVERGEIVNQLSLADVPVRSMTFTPNVGLTVVAAAGSRLYWWNMEGNYTNFVDVGGSIRQIAVSSSGNIVVALADQPAQYWMLRDGGFVLNQAAPVADVRSVAFGLNFQQLAMGTDDGRLFLGFGGAPLVTLQLLPFDAEIRAIAGESEGGAFAVGVWNHLALLRGALPETRYDAHQGWIHDLAFSPNGEVIASAGEDGFIHLWQLEPLFSSVPLATLVGHRGAVNALAFSPDGTRLVSVGDDGIVRVWAVQPSPPTP